MTLGHSRNLKGHALLSFTHHPDTTEVAYRCECGEVGAWRMTRKASIRDHAMHKVKVRTKET